jgi:hypothetical protein
MEPCQVVTAYLAGIRSLVDFDSPLNESYLPTLEELEERNSERVASRAAQHLRAFACVDMLVYRSYVGMPSGLGREGLFSTRLKSSAGLTKSIAQLRADIDELLGVQMEFDISTRLVGVTPSSTALLLAAASPVVAANQKDALEACQVLRRSLKNPRARLGRIGKCAAATVVRSGYSLLKIFEWANILLAKTEESTTWPKME